MFVGDQSTNLNETTILSGHAAHGDDINVLLHVHFDWQNLTEMELSQTALTKTKYSWNVKYSENPAKPVAFLRSKGVGTGKDTPLTHP